MPTARPPLEILLVEDNPADVRLTIEALKAARVPNNLQVARDGAEAIDLLKGAGAHGPRPDLILLDLNLPKKDGREVLADIKEDDNLRHIPVVILTTSQADQDILQSYLLRANAVTTKPVDVDQFFALVQAIEHFWLTVARLSRP
jgi:two-component system, chemotaxis family, response regulator Rcp1